MLSVYGNDEQWSSLSEQDLSELVAQDAAFQKQISETGELISVYGLSAATEAKVVRVRNGVPEVRDGRYLAAKDYLACYFVVEVPTIERAIEIAAQYPAANAGGVEVWPLMHAEGTR
jgi:hypothetical protein